MKIKNKFLRVLIWVITAFAILLLAAVIAGYSLLRFFVMPKINQNAVLDDDKINISDIARELGDKQIIANIMNFDKTSAHEMLSIITELNEENEDTETEVIDENEDAQEDVHKDVKKEGTTAYERILNEATKDEVAQGTAILSKISMAKVNELRKSGDTAALKAYIKSVLSPSEISAALKLYNKYKHLL